MKALQNTHTLPTGMSRATVCQTHPTSRYLAAPGCICVSLLQSPHFFYQQKHDVCIGLSVPQVSLSSFTVLDSNETIMGEYVQSTGSPIAALGAFVLVLVLVFLSFYSMRCSAVKCRIQLLLLMRYRSSSARACQTCSSTRTHSNDECVLCPCLLCSALRCRAHLRVLGRFRVGLLLLRHPHQLRGRCGSLRASRGRESGR